MIENESVKSSPCLFSVHPNYIEVLLPCLLILVLINVGENLGRWLKFLISLLVILIFISRGLTFLHVHRDKLEFQNVLKLRQALFINIEDIEEVKLKKGNSYSISPTFTFKTPKQ